MNNLIKKAFTLIELLVVIAIIGILSGLIIVGMNGMINSANIAKSQVFSNSLRNSLMLNIVSEWNFDELSSATNGAAINDSWSNNYDGTLSTGDALNKLKIGSECVNGKCLNFDGTDDYITLNTFPDIFNLSAYTISIWIKVTVGGGTRQAIGYGSSTVNNPIINVGINATNEAIFQHRDDANNLAYVNSNDTINDNNWHFIAAVRYAPNNHRIFVDGVRQSQTDADTVGVTTVNRAAIGMLPRISNDYLWNGLVDDVRIYNTSIPTSQIEEQYYAGLNNLLINGNIDKEEYVKILASK